MNKIINILKEKKSIPLDQFINISLYDKKFGYYMKKNPFGKDGDFITAPLISNLFGEMLAIWCIAFWEHIGKPKKILLVELGPGDGGDLVASPVDEEREEGRQDEDIDRGVLGAHHAEGTEHGVVGAADLVDLPRGEDERLGRGPDQDAEGDDAQEELDPSLVALGARDAVHPQPEVVVRREEERADEHRLHHEEPREHAAHHVDAELLVEPVDLEAQVVAGEGQGQEEEHGDEVADVPHLVVPRPGLVVLGRQESVRRVGGRDRATQTHVRDEPVNVDRVEQVVEEGIVAAQDLPGLGQAGWCHGESGPGIGDEHQGDAEEVQHQAKPHVGPAVLHLGPAVVVQVQAEGLAKEDARIEVHGRAEHLHEVAHELWVHP